MNLLRSVFVVLVGAVVGACSGDPAEPGTGSREPLRIVAGAGLTDTVFAEPVQALVVDVRDGTEGMVVTFAASEIERPCPYDPQYDCSSPTMFMSELGTAHWGSLVSLVLRRDGTAAVGLKFGLVRGPGAIEIRVPELGLVDTVEYTVLAGAPHSISLADEVLVAEGGDTTSLVAYDRGNNELEGVQDVTILSPSTLSLLPGGLLTTLAPGLGQVEVGGSEFDVAVLPNRRIVAYKDVTYGEGYIVDVRVDGEDERVIDRVITSAAATRDPLAERWVHHRPSDESYTTWQLHEVGPDGNAQPLGLPIGFQWAAWPRFTRDGQWLYFEARKTLEDCIGVWRVNRALTEVDSVLTLADQGLRLPRVSPDGSRLAALGGDCSPGTTEGPAVVVELASGDVEEVAGSFSGVAWAPDSERLAITGADGTRVVRFPGSTLVGDGWPGWYDLGSVDWAAEGDWVISGGFTSPVVVDVASGLLLETGLPLYSDFEWQ